MLHQFLLYMALLGDVQTLLSYCSGTSPAKLQITETKLRICVMLVRSVRTEEHRQCEQSQNTDEVTRGGHKAFLLATSIEHRTLPLL